VNSSAFYFYDQLKPILITAGEVIKEITALPYRSLIDKHFK